MRLRPANARERMEAACKQLLEATQGVAVWEWDDAYAAALATIASAQQQQVLDTLSDALPHRWDHVDIKSAPERVRHVSGVWGGVMSGQRLHVLDPDADPMLYAAWWPWGNRMKASLRVSCHARSETVAKADPQAVLRACFGFHLDLQAAPNDRSA